MAKTNFAALTSEQKTVWSRDLWMAARNNSFINQFAGSGPNAMVQRITELTKSEKGTRAVITLVADLEGDGIMGDADLEGNEEEIKAYDQVIQIDQIRNANRTTGRVADQKTIVGFRGTSKDVLGYWLGDRIDQVSFLTLSGADYRLKNNGGFRAGFTADGAGGYTRTAAAGQALYDLDFRADLTAPSTNRHYRWVAASSALAAGDTTAVVATDLPSYKMLVLMKAKAKDNYIRGIKGPGNVEYFHVFMTPQGMAKLKLDSDFLANVRNAGPRGDKNPLFSGSMVMQDGLIIHEFRHVFNTQGATAGAAPQAGFAGYKWGAAADVDGQRVLFCGAQALGLADLGAPSWDEDTFDYKNQMGISTGKILGFKKPVFHSNVTGTDEDFGVMVVDTAI